MHLPVGGPERAWNVLLVKTRKNLNFLRCIHVFDLVIKYCSDIKERNWLQLLFYFIVVMGRVASNIGMSFFHLFSRFYIEVFSYCNVKEMFANGIQNWFDHDCVIFGVLSWNMPRFVDFISAGTEICMNCSILILFWRHQFFSINSLRGILVCFLNMLVLFSHRTL